jgi:hypothetical protein
VLGLGNAFTQLAQEFLLRVNGFPQCLMCGPSLTGSVSSLMRASNVASRGNSIYQLLT